MTRIELQAEIDKLKPFYHSITLPCDDGELITPGANYQPVWENIRKARMAVDYKGKNVLDVATFDGMWAFEAERLGAAQVIATDCNWEAHRRLLFCRKLLNSNIVPLLNVPAHELVRRLDAYLLGWDVLWHHACQHSAIPPKFDIVQHLGLFYHLRDPLLSLLQCRSLIKDGGTLLIETGYLCAESRPLMLFNPPGHWEVYEDVSTWWAPSELCLADVLRASGFETKSATKAFSDGRIGRICVVAQAIPMESMYPPLLTELRNTYRTPGLEI
jgi:tRNA (mo5U34)-methyltransferase